MTRTGGTNPPIGGCACAVIPGDGQKAIPVMVLKAEVPESDLKKLLVQTIRELRALRREAKTYLDGYTSRGVRSEGLALTRLRKAAER